MDREYIYLEDDGIGYMASGLYYSGEHQLVAHGLKDGDAHAIHYAARKMAPLIPMNSVLVPIPGHKGFPGHTRTLCNEISLLTGAPVLEAIHGVERQSNYEAKLMGRPLTEEDMGFQQVREIPEGKLPVYIDNVVDLGTTARAAFHAVGRGMVVSYAITDNLLEKQDIRIEDTPDHDILLYIEKDNAEIYIADKELKIDSQTALHILHQRENMPHGDVWEDDFPPVLNHTNSAKARTHEGFDMAKRGDFDAAIRLIDELVKDDKIISIAQQYPNAIVAYVHSMESDKVNMIPAAYASRLEAFGLEVNDNIHAINKVSHTGASDIERISRRMRFEGYVEPSRDYIVLDDFITSGAELRDLKDYINDKGGRVVMFSTLGHGSFGKLSGVGIDKKYRDKLIEAGVTDQDLQKYGIASSIGCLTLSEAAKLYRTINTRRKEKANGDSTGLQFLRQRNSTIQEMAKGIPECKEVAEQHDVIRRYSFGR